MFNVLGPIINPARPRGMVVGIAEPELGYVYAQSIHVGGGACAGPTHVWELKDGTITEGTVRPKEFGLASHPLAEVAGGTPKENAETFKLLLTSGSTIPEKLKSVLDFVLINAGALLVSRAHRFASEGRALVDTASVVQPAGREPPLHQPTPPGVHRETRTACSRGAARRVQGPTSAATFFTFSVFLATLATLVVPYRISLCHPLARYRRPILGKDSRGYWEYIAVWGHQYTEQ
ncbi:hypothetical protein PsYK624_169580 [Phanerochaete sordida]|uniref:Glycosyl transferase family 3 domain-containing protein n=1 Tax=Phanerochaete sordida TaxID=48140 RepID=A0A9P3LMK6_9APHY|nr:hypothetical protein PsYK624_169580 [Phanerochaete sordida]